MNKPCYGLLVALSLCAVTAAAQTSSSRNLGEPLVTARDRVMAAYQSARWQLGPFQFEPTLALGDIGYVSNVYVSSTEAAESDLKARASAGLRSFFHLGPKVLVSPFAEVAENWWREQEQLRSTSESFGVEVFGNFNRLLLQLQAASVGTQRNLNSELEVPVDRQDERLQLDVEVNFWGPLRLFGTARDSGLRYSGTAAEDRIANLDLGSLDVDNELLRAGLAYELSGGLTVGVGLERTEATYLEDTSGRSNEGTGPLLRLSFQGAKLLVEADGSRRDLEFVGRPGGATRRQTEGRGRVRWAFTETVSAAVYGDVTLNASALDSRAIFESRRTGFNLRRDRGRRTQIAVYYEFGEDVFASVTSDTVTRTDDVRSYGLTAEIELTPRLRVQLGFLDGRWESTDPSFDRELRTLTTRVSLGGDLLPW